MSNKMNILCTNCGTNSGVEATESQGRNAAFVESKGWIPKNLIFYTGKDNWIFACSPECAKTSSEKILDEANVSDEKKEEIRQLIARWNAKIPAMAEETAAAVGKFADALKKITKK